MNPAPGTEVPADPGMIRAVAEVGVGDVIFARGAGGSYYAVVRGMRLNRLMVERCDGRQAGPVAVRDVVSVYKETAVTRDDPPAAARKLPTTQMRLDLS